MSRKAPVRPRKKVRDDFETIIESGEDTVEVVLPSLTYLKPKFQRAVQHMTESQGLWAIIEMSVDEETLDAIDEMDPDAFEQLQKDWAKHSGVSMGES